MKTNLEESLINGTSDTLAKQNKDYAQTQQDFDQQYNDQIQAASDDYYMEYEQRKQRKQARSFMLRLVLISLATIVFVSLYFSQRGRTNQNSLKKGELAQSKGQDFQFSNLYKNDAMYSSFQEASTQLDAAADNRTIAMTKLQSAIAKQIQVEIDKEVENVTMKALNNYIYQAEQKKLQKDTEAQMKNTKLGLRDNDRLKTINCEIDETKNRKQIPFHPHSCISSAECQGERQCTAFGWCRGKAMCGTYSRKAACLIIEAEDMKCKGDFDCTGARFCGDFGVCEGSDQC